MLRFNILLGFIPHPSRAVPKRQPDTFHCFQHSFNTFFRFHNTYGYSVALLALDNCAETSTTGLRLSLYASVAADLAFKDLGSTQHLLTPYSTTLSGRDRRRALTTSMLCYISFLHLL